MGSELLASCTLRNFLKFLSDQQIMAGDEEPQQAAAPEEDGGFNFDDIGDAGEGEGEFLQEGEEGAELPPQPKKKPKYFVHWDRRKAKFYDYNYDYGTNYYASMVDTSIAKMQLSATQATPRCP